MEVLILYNTMNSYLNRKHMYVFNRHENNGNIILYYFLKLIDNVVGRRVMCNGAITATRMRKGGSVRGT
jgi:hypothetical protein